MASYERRGQKWCVRWRNPGERNPRRFSVPDEKTAREFAAEATVAETRGEPWVPPPDRVPELASRKLEDLAVDWLRDTSRTVRSSTIGGYADSVERFLDHLRREPSWHLRRPR